MFYTRYLMVLIFLMLSSCLGIFGGGELPFEGLSQLMNDKSSSTDEPEIQLKEITLISSNEANNTHGFFFELVAAYDKEAIKKLQSLKSAEFFSQIRALLNDYPTIKRLRWEILPGTNISKDPVKFPNKPLAIFAFANYFNPNNHRMRIGTKTAMTIHFQKFGFKEITP